MNKAGFQIEAMKELGHLGFLGVLIFANIVALALYAFFTPFAPFIFWGLNGFLLGREYFQLAAMRRLGREGARLGRSGDDLGGRLRAVP